MRDCGLQAMQVVVRRQRGIPTKGDDAPSSTESTVDFACLGPVGRSLTKRRRRCRTRDGPSLVKGHAGRQNQPRTSTACPERAQGIEPDFSSAAQSCGGEAAPIAVRFQRPSAPLSLQSASGAMSMRQNEPGAAPIAWTMAARMIEAWVITVTRPDRLF